MNAPIDSDFIQILHDLQPYHMRVILHKDNQNVQERRQTFNAKTWDGDDNYDHNPRCECGSWGVSRFYYGRFRPAVSVLSNHDRVGRMFIVFPTIASYGSFLRSCEEYMFEGNHRVDVMDDNLRTMVRREVESAETSDPMLQGAWFPSRYIPVYSVETDIGDNIYIDTEGINVARVSVANPFQHHFGRLHTFNFGTYADIAPGIVALDGITQERVELGMYRYTNRMMIANRTFQKPDRNVLDLNLDFQHDPERCEICFQAGYRLDVDDIVANIHQAVTR